MLVLILKRSRSEVGIKVALDKRFNASNTFISLPVPCHAITFLQMCRIGTDETGRREAKFTRGGVSYTSKHPFLDRARVGYPIPYSRDSRGSK